MFWKPINKKKKGLGKYNSKSIKIFLFKSKENMVKKNQKHYKD